jgi:hypothetical protein
MKTTKLISAVLLVLIGLTMFSCDDPGVAYSRLNGDEQNLPEELRGLKVYSVSLGEGNFIKVAVLGNQTSSTYQVGKVQETTVVVNKDHFNERVIVAKEIIMENDSLILIHK